MIFALTLGLGLSGISAADGVREAKSADEWHDLEPAIATAAPWPESPAHARVIVGLERVLGLAVAADVTRISPFQSVYDADPIAPATFSRSPARWGLEVPRLAVDAVFGHATLGGVLSVMAPKQDLPVFNESYTHYEATLAVVGIRAGALFCDRGRVCLWPRGGLTLATVSGTASGWSVDDRGPAKPYEVHMAYRTLNVSLEPSVMVGIVPHLAAELSVIADVPLPGGSSPGGAPLVLAFGSTLALRAWW